MEDTKKIIKIYKTFLMGNKTYEELADEFGFTVEEVKLHINDKNLIKKCFPKDYEMYILAIQARIKYNEKINEQYGKKY